MGPVAIEVRVKGMRPRCRVACHPAGDSASGRQPSLSAEGRRRCLVLHPLGSWELGSQDRRFDVSKSRGGNDSPCCPHLGGPLDSLTSLPWAQILVSVSRPDARIFRLKGKRSTQHERRRARCPLKGLPTPPSWQLSHPRGLLKVMHDLDFYGYAIRAHQRQVGSKFTRKGC